MVDNIFLRVVSKDIPVYDFTFLVLKLYIIHFFSAFIFT